MHAGIFEKLIKKDDNRINMDPCFIYINSVIITHPLDILFIISQENA